MTTAMAARGTDASSTGEAAALAGKYLTLALAGEEYGLPVMKVREIIKLLDTTAVPHAPQYVRGVINLRGKVIPVVDLRLKFGFPPQDYDDRTCIIVVEVELRSSTVLMGLIVDRVSEVLTIGVNEVEGTPDFGDQVDAAFIRGVAKIKGRVKLLLDLDRIFGGGATLF